MFKRFVGHIEYFPKSSALEQFIISEEISIKEVEFDELKKASPVTEIDYSLISCDFQRMSNDINFSSENRLEEELEPIGVIEEIQTLNFENDFRNRLVHNDIATMIEFIVKSIPYDDYLTKETKAMQEGVRTALKTKDIKLENSSLELIIDIVCSSLEIVHVLNELAQSMRKINEEIRNNYLSLRNIERIKFFKFPGSDSHSLAEFAIFLQRNYFVTVEKLFDSNKGVVDMRNRFLSEKGRLHSFATSFSSTYRSKLDNLVTQQHSKYLRINQQLQRLKEIDWEMSRQSKDFYLGTKYYISNN